MPLLQTCQWGGCGVEYDTRSPRPVMHKVRPSHVAPAEVPSVGQVLLNAAAAREDPAKWRRGSAGITPLKGRLEVRALLEQHVEREAALLNRIRASSLRCSGRRSRRRLLACTVVVDPARS